MLEIFSSETFMPASTQSGVGIGEANSDAMFREQADESNAFSTTIWSGSPILATSLLGMGASTSLQERRNVVVVRHAPERLPAGSGPRETFSLQRASGRCRQSGGKTRCVARTPKRSMGDAP